jgi:hypothetical protein
LRRQMFDLPGRADSKVAWHLLDRRGRPSSKEGIRTVTSASHPRFSPALLTRASHPPLSLIRNDDTALDDQLGLYQIPVTLERITVEDDDVCQLAGLERPELITHLDVRRGVWSH